MKPTTVITGVLLTLFLGCNSEDSQANSDQNGDPKNFSAGASEEMLGTWISGCYENPGLDGQGGEGYLVTKRVITQEAATVHYDMHKQSDCSDTPNADFPFDLWAKFKYTVGSKVDGISSYDVRRLKTELVDEAFPGFGQSLPSKDIFAIDGDKLILGEPVQSGYPTDLDLRPSRIHYKE